MKRHFSAFCFLLAAFQLLAQATVESVPNQKLINGSYVSNPDGILDVGTIMQIDSLLKLLETSTSAQVAVVAVASIGDKDAFDFAQRLFDAWGIGNKGNSNGLLLLLVHDTHVIRFHTGYGVEGILTDVVCKRIQRDYMVPEFKNGNYNAGMLSGIQQVVKIMTVPVYAEELHQSEENELSDFSGFVIFLAIFFAPVLLILFIIKNSRRRFADSKRQEYTSYPEMRLTRWGWLLEFVVVPLLIVIAIGISTTENAVGVCIIALYLYFMVTLFLRLRREKKVISRFLGWSDYYNIVEFIRREQIFWLFTGLLFPLPFLGYFFYHLTRKRHYRNHSRKCEQCGGSMHKLHEKQEDEFLTKAQQLEETIRAVDYDVWKCDSCHATHEWSYPHRHSKYQPCPKCGTTAYHFVSRRTIKDASYSSGGSGEEVHTCKFCGYRHASKYSIPQLSSSSSGSGSSFGSGGSSGGSWGGGSSGGGGASSSW